LSLTVVFARGGGALDRVGRSGDEHFFERLCCFVVAGNKVVDVGFVANKVFVCVLACFLLSSIVDQMKFQKQRRHLMKRSHQKKAENARGPLGNEFAFDSSH
jgi:hypothetical protein